MEKEQFIVISVYKLTCGIEEFENKMEMVIFKASKSKMNVVICVDFKINILYRSVSTTKFINLFNLYNFHNIIFRLTKIIPTNATCVDKYEPKK